MYETFYNFSANPFQLNPDPSFYFASKGHSRTLAYLKYGIYQGDGFIVITGEIGAGKTMMVRALLDELDSEKILAAQLNSTQLDADDLVHAVAAAFGLSNQGLAKAEMLAQFESFLISLAAENRRALLIVDEAQNLTPRAMEELRMLSNFQLSSRSLLQSFLVGQPELREILRAPTMKQLRQRIIASYHLGPMDRAETRAYVLHRLEHVGWRGDPQIDDAIFERLYEATGGLPRMINAVCNRLLLSACIAKLHVIGSAEFSDAINELRDEIGPDVRVSAAAEARAASREARTSDVRPFMSAALTTRLDRIEKSVSTAVELLQQLAPVAARTTSAAAPRPRPRFGVRGM